MHLDPFAEPRRVVVSQCFGVAKGLKDWVGLQHLSFDGVLTARHLGEERKAVLCGLCLTSATLSRDEHGLVSSRGRA